MGIQWMNIVALLLLLIRWHVDSVAAGDAVNATTTKTTTIQRHLQKSAIGVGKIKNFRLINADTNLPIFNLKDGMVIDITTLSTNNLNVQAVTFNGTVVKVQFDYNDITNIRTESIRPFAFCGDGLPIGNYYKCKVLGIGNHIISATPYSASGEVGVTKQITFRIADSNSENDSTPSDGNSCNIAKFIESEWQPFTPNYPVSVGEPQGVMIGNDIILFAGFINKFSNVINQTYARDVTIDNSPWRRMDDMPLPVGVTHAATTVVSMKVYLCGGYHGGHPGPHIPYCFVYDHSKAPGRNVQWSRIADLPNNGTAGAGMIYDTKANTLYYAGGGQRLKAGSPHPVDLNNTWKYSLNDGTQSTIWVASTPVPYTANHLSAVTHRNAIGHERHFFVGGQKGEYEILGNLADHFEFIPDKEKWIRRTSMLHARSHATASTRSVRCGYIVVGGSFNSMTNTNKKNRTNDVSYYDIPTDTWTSIGVAPVAMATPVVTIHESGYMYFIDNTQQSFRRRFQV